MIEEIEISPSSIAKCKRCIKIIGKGTPRGKVSNRYHSHNEYSYYCYKCFPKVIEEELGLAKIELERLKKLPKELDKLIKEKQKEIIAMEI